MSLYALVLIGDPPLTALSYSQLCPLPWTAKTTITEVDAIIKKSLRMPGELEYYLLDVPLKPSTLAGVRDLSKPLQDREELLFHSVRLWPQEFDSSFDDLHVEKPVGRERVISLVVIWCPTPLETLESYSLATIVEDIFRRDAVAQSGRQRDPPSTGAKSRNLVPAQQANQPAAAFNYRPQELTPSPLSLYNPAFATFRRGMANPTENFKFSKEEVERATDFIIISSKYYVDENARMTALRQCSLFPTPERSQSAWCTSEIQTNATIIKPDGNIPLALAVRIVICFLELKNGGGDGGCDPNEQVQLDFIKVVSSDQYAPVRSVSCCPTFLVSLSGNQLAIWGAVFAERFFFEPLAFLHVGPQPVCTCRSPSETGVREVAKVLRLLNDALDELTSYYKTLPIPPPVHVSSYGKKIRSGKHANSTTTSRIPSSDAARFPHWTSFKIGENKATLTYTRRLAGDADFERTVFLAKMTSESISPPVRDVVVKFTYCYSEEGHRLLADKNLAPTLYHCAYEDAVGMWVVVMDVVEGGTVQKGSKLNTKQGKSLRHAVRLLHDKGLVFGDLREPNVIVKPDTIFLIDFEWCGREDVDGKGLGVRYPTHIAMGPDYDWAEGVGPDEFIRKAHDLYRLQQMCGRDE